MSSNHTSSSFPRQLSQLQEQALDPPAATKSDAQPVSSNPFNDDHFGYDLDDLSWEVAFRNSAENRLRKGRIFLQSIVVGASPLISIMTEGELGAALDAVSAVDPATGWRSGDAGWRKFWGAPMDRVCEMEYRRPPIGRRPDADSRFGSLFKHNGVVLRRPTDERGGFGLKVVGPNLEMATTTDKAVFVTLAGKVRVQLDIPLPATLVAAARGLMLDKIVGGPAFEGRGFRVRSARVQDGTTLITAETGVVPFAMPWCNLA